MEKISYSQQSRMIYVWFAVQLGWRMIAWAIVPFMLLTARKVKNVPEIDDGTQRESTQRYDLSNWLRWATTIDERLPGALYEASHKKLLTRWYGGWWLASYVWLAYRNVGHRIMARFGRQVPSYMEDMPYTKAMTAEQRKQYKVWRKTKRVGPLVFMWGYKTVPDLYEQYDKRSETGEIAVWAYPWYTIRRYKGNEDKGPLLYS